MSAESVITIVRSLVISKKPPCLVTDILRDYREIEGGPLPFQKFGYRNAEEFLASSNSFILDRYGGNTYVTAKASADSAHIQSMVRLQKAAKKKPKAAARFPKSNNSNQNWNRTSYSSVYGQNNSNNYRPSNNRPNYNNRQPLRPAGDRNNNNNNSNGNNNFQNFQKKSQQQNNQQSQSQSQGNKPNMVRSSSNPDSKLVVDNWRNPVVNTNGASKSNSVSGTFSMPEDMRNRLTAANKPPKEKPREEPVKADDLRNKLNAARSVNQEDLRNRLIAKMNNVISNSNSNVPKPQQQQQQVPKTEVQRIQNHHTQEQSKAPIANRLNYMNRIAKANGPAQKQENNLTVIKDYKHYQQKPQKPQPEKPFTFEKSLSPIVQLQEYCIARNLAPPQYQILTYQSRYKCHLVMNNRTYVSDEFGSEMEAKVACSMEAIEEMKAKEAIPLCTDPNYELKIHEKLLQKSGGVFLRGFPQWFETTFQKRIPHNWYQNLQKMPELFTIENSNGDCLIFARVATLSPAVSSSGSSDMEYFASGRISLPFDEKYWNLYITHCKSTVEVWGRIVGMGSSDQFENLMNDIDLHMLTKARRPQSISVGQIYLSSISDCWHRIRVEERKGNMFLCFYIDFGDEEWVDVEKIYVCEPKFLALPPQGIVFSLFGLEDFSGNRCAERILNNKLPNQSLVAEVLTKKEVYEKAFDENCGDYKIQVVLYDTSSNEDVNLNEILVKEICDETPPPVLKSDNSTVNVNVTHIDDKGNLFVQIRNSDWTYVEKLIYELVESKQLKQHKIKKMEISMAGTYLVRSSIHGNFKRAVLHSPPTSENVDTYDMFYVDYGSRANIHISDIYRLESLSAALAKYPSQAIQVKLANLPPITPDLLERIRTLLPSNTSAIIKVVKNAVIQEVLLYSRMDNGAMYTVNDSILIELDLKQNENGTSSTNQQPRKSMKTSSPINYVSVEQKLPDLQDYKLPEINEYMDVLVSMSCNPLNFTVLPYDDNESLDKLMKDMKEHYSTTDEYIPVDVIKKGEAYACKHNNFYHRCIVTQVLPKPHFSLFLCDLGEVIVLSNDYLKTLPTKFRELPKQAMKAKLYGIKPKMNDWTLQDCIDFKENTVNKPFVSKIMNISKDNLENDVTVLELHLIDTSTEDDIYMHQTLIDDGIAIPTNL